MTEVPSCSDRSHLPLGKGDDRAELAATAATNGKQPGPATVHNTRAIRANLDMPGLKSGGRRRRGATEHLAYVMRALSQLEIGQVATCGSGYGCFQRSAICLA